NPTPLSMVKTMEGINRWFQLKTLGLEWVTGAVSFFGINLQVMSQSGHYFKTADFYKNFKTLSALKFGSKDEKEVFVQLLDTFTPLREDPSYEILKKAGHKLSGDNLGDLMYMFMRKPELMAEKALFLSILDNTMVVDGRLVNIREYVNNKYKGQRKTAS